VGSGRGGVGEAGADPLHVGGGVRHRTPRLLQRFKPQDGYLRIQSLANGGWGIQVYAADKDTGQGIQPTLCLVDEGHVHKDLGLYRTWRGKLRKRNGQIVMISTAGEPGTTSRTTRDKIRDEAARARAARAVPAARGRQPDRDARVPGAEPEQARDLKLVKAANPLSTITKAELAEILSDPTLDYGEDWLRQTCNIPARSSKAAVSTPTGTTRSTARRSRTGRRSRWARTSRGRMTRRRSCRCGCRRATSGFSAPRRS
jgi:hypothetical protein